MLDKRPFVDKLSEYYIGPNQKVIYLMTSINFFYGPNMIKCTQYYISINILNSMHIFIKKWFQLNSVAIFVNGILPKKLTEFYACILINISSDLISTNAITDGKYNFSRSKYLPIAGH